MIKKINKAIILTFLFFLLLPMISMAQSSVQSTISLVDGSLHEGNYIQNPSLFLNQVASLYYDSQTNYIYIINNGSNTISVLNPINDTFVGYIQLTSTPLGITQGSNTIFITFSNQIWEVNATNFAVISRIPLAGKPCSVLFINNYLYVVEYSDSLSGPSNTILVINPQTSQIVKEIQEAGPIKEMIYTDGKIYTVSSPWQNTTTSLETECLVNLTIINPTNNNVLGVTYINVSSMPLFTSLEYYDNQLVLIVIGFYSTYISFLSLSGNAINMFATYPLYTTEGLPTQVIYNNGYIYASYPCGTVVINTQINQTVTTIPISSVAMLYLNGYLYVGGGNNLYVISTSNFKIVKVLQGLTYPNSMVYYKGYIFVQNPVGDSITVIDPLNNMIVKVILLNGSPILEEPAGNYMYVVAADEYGYNITVINLNTLTVDYSIPLSTYYSIKSMLYVNGALYLGMYSPNGNGYIYVINLTTDNITAKIDVGEDPFSMLYVSGKIFVADKYSGDIYVINPKGNSVIKKIQLPGNYIYSIINADGYILAGGDDYISAINTTTANIVENYSYYNIYVNSMTYVNGTLYAYTTSITYNNMSVDVINLSSGEVISSIVVSKSFPTQSFNVSMLYAEGYVFVTDPFNNSVLAVNVYNLSTQFLSVGYYPTGILNIDGRLYVLNEKSQTISIIEVEKATNSVATTSTTSTTTQTASTSSIMTTQTASSSTTSALVGGLFFLFLILLAVGLAYKFLRRKKGKQHMPQPIVPSSPSQPSQPQPIIPPPPPQPPQPPPQPPSIYQLGQGIIKRDGSTFFTLSSSVYATIISAKIEGTTLTPININPSTIKPGSNEITIKFNDVSSLTPGMPYKIILTVNIEGNIVKEINVYAFYS